MRNIGSFFDPFKNAISKEMALRQSIVDAVKKNTGANITTKDVELRNKIVRIRSNPALKNQIFIKKEAILKDIREANAKSTIIDVR